MAKLCSSYGSSPNFSFLSDEYYGNDILPSMHNDLGLSNTDLGLINPDPAELFEDINLLNIWPTSSICSDIQKIKADSPANCGGLFENGSLDDIKPEIRNMDCMWSASTSLLGTSASSILSDGGNSATAVPLAAITNAGNSVAVVATPARPPPVVVVANNKSNQQKIAQTQIKNSQQQQHLQQQQQQFATTVKKEIKQEPLDDYEQQLQQHNIPINSKTQQNTEQHIPPGASLLRKSQQRNKQQQQQVNKQQTQSTILIPKIYAGEFVRERDQLSTTTTQAPTAAATTTTTINNKNNNLRNKNNKTNNNNNATENQNIVNGGAYIRPDTPHSLDDDVAHNKQQNMNDEYFKHNIDLRACVMGSNNISLTADPTNFINHVSQELQDTSKTQIDMRFVNAGCSSLAEVAEVLEGMSVGDGVGGGGGGGGGCDGTTASSSGIDCDSDSAGEDDDEWQVGESTRYSMDSMLNVDEQDDDDYAKNAASPVPSQDSLMSGTGSNVSQSAYTTQQPPYLMHSDHSYTRCKDGMEDLGTNLETPSDSGEC